MPKALRLCALCQQVIQPSPGLDPTILQHDDLIGSAQHLAPVRDNETGGLREGKHSRGEIRGRDGGGLTQRGRAEKEQRYLQERLRRSAALRRVDEPARDLWADELESNGRKEEYGEQEGQRPLRPKVVNEHVSVLPEGELYLRFLSFSRQGLSAEAHERLAEGTERSDTSALYCDAAWGAKRFGRPGSVPSRRMYCTRQLVCPNVTSALLWLGLYWD